MTYDKEKILSLLATTFLSDEEDFYEERNHEFLRLLNTTEYNYAYGASKFVLIPHKGDYVIKIPYTGGMEHDTTVEEDAEGCPIYYPVDYFRMYSGSECEDRCWDYCAAEANRYHYAEIMGFGECFAKTELIGFVRNFPIYVQEKGVSCDDNYIYHSEEELRKTSDSLKGYVDIPEGWLTDFRLYYGEDELNRFVTFLRKNGWDDDLTDNNIGYIGSQPVLLDYSSFNE